MPHHALNRLTKKDCNDLTCSPDKKRARIRDGGELYLEALPSGKKFWRMRVFTPDGRENRLTFGCYPEVTIDEARQRRDEVRRQQRDGKDPIEQRRQAKAAANELTFAAAYQEWFERRNERWSDIHRQKVRRQVTKFLLPRLGKRAIKKIEPPELRDAVEAIHDSSPKGRRQTAKETLGIARQIFAYAIANHGSEDFRYNIATPIIEARSLLPPQVEHHKAVTTAEDLGRVIKALRTCPCNHTAIVAVNLIAILFLRQANIRTMRWQHVDLEHAIVTIPRNELKIKSRPFDLVSPLPKQAVQMLESLPRDSVFVFPQKGDKSKPISNSTIQRVRSMTGVAHEQTFHGFRSTARSMLIEQGFSRDAIEVQLDHGSREQLGSAYDRAMFINERREMLQWWADFLDKLAST